MLKQTDAMAQKPGAALSSGTTSTTTTTTEEAAPTPPQRFTLVLKMGWEQLKGFYKGFKSNDLMDTVKKERKDITKKLESGKDINQREIELLNNATKEKFKKRFGDFQQALYNSLELKESDDQKVKLVKIQLAKEVMQWLEKLEAWLVKRLSDIFDEGKVPEDQILQRTENFIRELNVAMKPPAIEELIKKLEANTPRSE